MSNRYLVFDGTNLLYRIFYAKMYSSGTGVRTKANRRGIESDIEGDLTDDAEDPNIGIELSFHSAIMAIQRYYRELSPDKIFMCFDGYSWRKNYTESEACVSKKKYKGNRRQNMTPSQQELHERFLVYVKDFEELIDKHTTIVMLKSPHLEADDLISGLCQVLDGDITVVSSDKDFIQLLRNPNVSLIDPLTNEHRTLDEWNGDADYYLFMKCIKGDPGDNVQSAFPGVRKTRIKKAYDDDYELVQLMQETWSKKLDDESITTFLVADLFAENELLVNLWAQPEEIKQEIFSHIDTKLEEKKKLNYMKLLAFFGKHQLNFLIKNIEQFIPVLSL